MSKKKYRVLSDTYIEGVNYKPNDVVMIDDKVGDAFESLDASEEAVKYCVKELKADPVDHEKAVKALSQIDQPAEDEGTK